MALAMVFSFLSFTTVLVVLVYLVDIPNLILNGYTGASEVIKEYYYDNAIRTFVWDFTFVAIYLSVAMYASALLKIDPKDHHLQLLVAGITTALLTVMFSVWFNKFGDENNFFTKWFKTVGNGAAIYDVVIVGAVYILMVCIHDNIQQKVILS